MFAVLLKLIPFRDYVYAAIAIAAVVFWVHHNHVEQRVGAQREVAAVQAATAKVQAAAAATIKQKDSEYASNLAKVQTDHESQLTANADQHNADLQRLRSSYQSHGGANTAVGSTGGAAPGPATGAQSTGGLGDVPAGLALELADALRHDDAELQACWNERDELTGK